MNSKLELKSQEIQWLGEHWEQSCRNIYLEGQKFTKFRDKAKQVIKVCSISKSLRRIIILISVIKLFSSLQHFYVKT